MPVVMRNSSFSSRGDGCAPPLIESMTTTVFMAASMAVPHTSPSPCRACPSPMASIAPSTLTPKYVVVPARSSGVSMFPPWVAGRDAHEHLVGCGRHPDGAVHRIQGQVHGEVRVPGLVATVPASRSIS